MLTSRYALPFLLPVSLILAAPVARSQTCFHSPSVSADPGTFEHAWSGLVYDVFLLPYSNGTSEVWTVEDGGRIRHRDTNFVWETQSPPKEVDHTLQRIHFLDNGLDGWACGEGGWLISTDDGGDNWDLAAWVDCGSGVGENLYDVHFLDVDRGWLMAKHGFWYTTNGGGTWTEGNFKDDGGTAIDFDDVELYAFDIYDTCAHECSCSGTCSCPLDGIFGLAVGEPGIVWRTKDGITWKEAFDMRDLCPCVSNISNPFQSDCPNIYDACPGGDGSNCNDSASEVFEPWDVDIRHSTGDPLAIFVGAVGTQCGYIFASDDWGCTWELEPHLCQVTTCASCDFQSDPLCPVDHYTGMYGVGIYDGDGSAIGAGYLGQHVRRPAGSVPQSWVDHSQTGSIFTTTNPINFPMYGADADEGSYGEDNGEGYIVGLTNHIRRTVDGGEVYDEEGLDPPEEWRIHDVGFTADDTGWQGGQFWRLAKTTDSGTSWPTEGADAVPGGLYLNAIAMGGDESRGVAVGQGKSGGSATQPKILFTDDNSTWFDPTSITFLSGDEGTYLGGELRDVTWSHDSASKEYWAVGDDGLILVTTNGGDDWDQVEPEALGTGADYHDVDFHGVAFASPVIGIFVGRRYDTDPEEGIALRYAPGSGTWADISPSFTTYELNILPDVSISGSKAYAVGQTKPTTGDREGMVLISTGGAFVPVSGIGPIVECKVGENAREVQVLSEIEAVSQNDIWVGGSCGQLWHYDGSSWTKEKSQTSSHIRGLNCPSADVCYVATHRSSNIHSTVTRMK